MKGKSYNPRSLKQYDSPLDTDAMWEDLEKRRRQKRRPSFLWLLLLPALGVMVYFWPSDTMQTEADNPRTETAANSTEAFQALEDQAPITRNKQNDASQNQYIGSEGLAEKDSKTPSESNSVSRSEKRQASSPLSVNETDEMIVVRAQGQINPKSEAQNKSSSRLSLPKTSAIKGALPPYSDAREASTGGITESHASPIQDQIKPTDTERSAAQSLVSAEDIGKAFNAQTVNRSADLMPSLTSISWVLPMKSIDLDIPERQILSSSAPKKPKSDNTFSAGMTASYGLLLQNPSLAGENLFSQADYRSAGLRFQKRVANQWSIESGLQQAISSYRQDLMEQFSTSKMRMGIQEISINQAGDTSYTSGLVRIDIDSTLRGHYWNEIRYVEIPLLANYELDLGVKTSVILQTGIHARYRQTSQWKRWEGNRLIREDIDSPRFGLAAQLNAGVQQDIGAWHLRMLARYRHSLTELNTTQMGTENLRDHALSLELGLFYGF